MAIIYSFSNAVAESAAVSGCLINFAAQINDALINHNYDDAKKYLVKFYHALVRNDEENEIDDDQLEIDCCFWRKGIDKLGEESPSLAFTTAIRSLYIFNSQPENVSEIIDNETIDAISDHVNKIDLENDAELCDDINGYMMYVMKFTSEVADDSEDSFATFNKFTKSWLNVFDKLTPEQRFKEVKKLQEFVESFDEPLYSLERFLQKLMLYATVNANGINIIPTKNANLPVLKLIKNEP